MFSVPVKIRPALPHIAVWALFLLAPFFIRVPAHATNDFSRLPVGYFVFTNLLNAGLFYANAYYLYPRYCNRKKWWLWLITVVLLTWLLFQLKIIIIQTGFPAIDIDASTWRFAFFSTTVFLLLSIIFRFALDNWQREKKLKEIQALQLDTELKFLRSQVNPHFLFNVLTNLVSLARTRSEQLEPSLILLADLMRYMLYNPEGMKQPLIKEIQYLESYIRLQELRFGNDVTITTDLDIDKKQDHLAIEPMLLIPFVENAFKHGVGWIDGIEKPAISICLRTREHLLEFTVQNQVSEQDSTKDLQSGIGLTNVQSRLDLLYPNKHTLIIKKEIHSYFVHLIIDLHDELPSHR
jgi:hypothetical protein